MMKPRFILFGIVVVSIFAVVFAIVYVIYMTNQYPPTIKEGEFPFRFVYELNGNRYEVEDVVVCKFIGLQGIYSNTRTWETYLKSKAETIDILKAENVYSVLSPKRFNSTIYVYLDYGSSEYYMGDPNVKSAPLGKPSVCYYEAFSSSPRENSYEITPLTEKQLEKFWGIKIIEFTFSKPIKNSF